MKLFDLYDFPIFLFLVSTFIYALGKEFGFFANF